MTQQATRFARVRHRLETYEPAAGWRSWIYEFLLFGFKQGWACLFGGAMLALLLAKGLTLDEAAAELKIRKNTTRAHLRSIFAKTGVRRQTTLIHLLLSSVASIS